MSQTEKKKPDYTNSAERLCNPPGVMNLLVKLHKSQKTLDILEGNRPAKLENTIEITQKRIADITAAIKDAIDAEGSYQDIEAGVYAVKYRRMSRTYYVEPFKERFPKFVDVVVEEAINVKALDGLIKGGLIKEDELLRPLRVDGLSVITETPTYAFYIR